ncbi:MAG TPA: VanW family protein [Gaiellaceae bacterium]|nr:VanW family protein [Gaiellaceae bacterium]
MRRLGIFLLSTLGGLAVLAAAAVAARDAVYWQQALPGVELRRAELSRPVDVDIHGKAYEVRPGEVLMVDSGATNAALVRAGHDSFRDRVRRLVDPSPPTLRVDPVLVARPAANAVAERLSATLPKPRPAQIVSRRGAFRVVPSLAGDAVEPRQLLASLRQAALTGVRTLSPELMHVEPALTTSAAEEAVAEARQLVAEPITLSFKGEDVGSLAPKRLARLVRFRQAGDHFRVTFAPDRIAKAVEPYLSDWRARAVNARFVVDGRQVRVRPSKPGLAPDGPWISDSITAAASSSIRRASLRLKQTRADLTTAEANTLGIREQISTFTTDMGTSSSNRIHNVQLMAEYIDGTIVEPGHVFSFNDRVGPRTVERGFREGQMIIGSLLLPSIGGGVCQTATTLFNNAFDLGLPIVERHNHSFYISHYPLGRDATVSWGGPDFAFKNDLKTGILIKTSYTTSTLTFTFYGTDPERRVVATTGPRVNWRSPQVSYALDPYAPRGSVRTVAGSNQSGFDVTVTRKVYEHGKLERRDAFTSAYIAVGPTTIYGPGSSIPGPYFVLPRV